MRINVINISERDPSCFFLFVFSIRYVWNPHPISYHSDVIMRVMASQITGVWIVCTVVYPGTNHKENTKAPVDRWPKNDIYVWYIACCSKREQCHRHACQCSEPLVNYLDWSIDWQFSLDLWCLVVHWIGGLINFTSISRRARRDTGNNSILNVLQDNSMIQNSKLFFVWTVRPFNICMSVYAAYAKKKLS